MNVSKIILSWHAKQRLNERYPNIDILKELETAVLFGAQKGQSQGWLCNCEAVCIIDNNEIITILTKEQYIANISRYQHKFVDYSAFLSPVVIPDIEPKLPEKKIVPYNWNKFTGRNWNKRKSSGNGVSEAQKEKERQDQEASRKRKEEKRKLHEEVMKKDQEKKKIRWLLMEEQRKKKEKKEYLKTRSAIQHKLLIIVKLDIESNEPKEVRHEKLKQLGYQQLDVEYYDEIYFNFLTFKKFAEGKFGKWK